MTSNRIDVMQSRNMDETWDMNMHINPIDEETAETISKHKAILMNNSDDFVAFVKHTESKLNFLFLIHINSIYRCS